MKTIIVLGSEMRGWCNKDYLMSREDFQSPFGNQEFRIINDPDGLTIYILTFIRISQSIMLLTQFTIYIIY